MKKSGRNVPKAKARIRVCTLICKKCGDTIFSRALHDFRGCSCWSIAVDGGFDYFGVTGDPDDMITKIRYMPVTRQQLYQDWNWGYEKYGLIKGIPKKEKRSGKTKAK